MAFLSIADSFAALLVGWLVVVARAVPRKTPIYFMIFTYDLQIDNKYTTYKVCETKALVVFYNFRAMRCVCKMHMQVAFVVVHRDTEMRSAVFAMCKKYTM